MSCHYINIDSHAETDAHLSKCGVVESKGPPTGYQDGFTMLQYSVYIRHCASLQSRDVHMKRVKIMVPGTGQVSMLCVTDKQYSEIVNFWGVEKKKIVPQPRQLEFF